MLYLGTLNFADMEGWKLAESEGWKAADTKLMEGRRFADIFFVVMEVCRKNFHQKMLQTQWLTVWLSLIQG